MTPDIRRKLIVLKTGSTHPEIAEQHGDYEDWIKAGLAWPDDDGVTVIDAQTVDGLPVDPPAAAVITGAHEMVTDRAKWSEAAATWLSKLVAQQIPVLAICYGHQLLAHALGGEVGDNPLGREVGTFTIRCLPAAREDPLLCVMPTDFPAHTSHAQSVLRLPPDAVPLASSDAEPVQAFRVGPSAWGVQFHPEFSESIMRQYLARQRDELREQGQDVERLAEAVTASPAGRVLEQFGRIARPRQSQLRSPLKSGPSSGPG